MNRQIDRARIRRAVDFFVVGYSVLSITSCGTGQGDEKT